MADQHFGSSSSAATEWSCGPTETRATLCVVEGHDRSLLAYIAGGMQSVLGLTTYTGRRFHINRPFAM